MGKRDISAFASEPGAVIHRAAPTREDLRVSMGLKLGHWSVGPIGHSQTCNPFQSGGAKQSNRETFHRLSYLQEGKSGPFGITATRPGLLETTPYRTTFRAQLHPLLEITSRTLSIKVITCS